ncbi:hypothetical protein QCA50_001649 [Cerrena zonata]|uniref:Uncharacterized protein n=1 Tax=Cerrena zonata TaxID=2478898 RepID=A0AAW0GMB9_9APHY
MRTFFTTSILLATATVLSTSLVSGIPLNEHQASPKSLSSTVPKGHYAYLVSRANQVIDNPVLRTLGLAHDPNGSGSTGSDPSSTQQPHEDYAKNKRASDDQTAGGNAYTGNSGNVSSGDIDNIAGPDSTITNASGNNVGAAGQSVTGNGRGGEGKGRGPGGNAYTGSSGDANGGSIHNDAGTVQNMQDANNAGDGGLSESGVATGGGN